MFGVLPAYGLYIHHADEIVLNNVRFRVEADGPASGDRLRRRAGPGADRVQGPGESGGRSAHPPGEHARGLHQPMPAIGRGEHIRASRGRGQRRDRTPGQLPGEGARIVSTVNWSERLTQAVCLRLTAHMTHTACRCDEIPQARPSATFPKPTSSFTGAIAPAGSCSRCAAPVNRGASKSKSLPDLQEPWVKHLHRPKGKTMNLTTKRIMLPMSVCCITLLAAVVLAAEVPSGETTAIMSQTLTLDGPDWTIATDPDNKGRDEKWFDAPRARRSRRPFPG